MLSAKLNQIVANNLNRFECLERDVRHLAVVVVFNIYIYSWGQISFGPSQVKLRPMRAKVFTTPRGDIKSDGLVHSSQVFVALSLSGASLVRFA